MKMGMINRCEIGPALCLSRLVFSPFARRICFSGDKSDQDSKVAPQKMTQAKTPKVSVQKAEL